MPNYVYKCTACGLTESIFMSMSADPRENTECPECNGVATRRIGKPTFVMERETLGKWYKENTGKELLGEG